MRLSLNESTPLLQSRVYTQSKSNSAEEVRDGPLHLIRWPGLASHSLQCFVGLSLVHDGESLY